MNGNAGDDDPAGGTGRGNAQADSGRTAAVLALMEAEAIEASHRPEDWTLNPAFPAGAAEKDYGASEALRQTVLAIAGAPDPERLLEEARAAGAPSEKIPVVLKLCTASAPERCVVWHGNARVMGLQLAYRSGKAGLYRERLRTLAPALGLPVSQVDSLRAPVLVRLFPCQMPPAAAAAGNRHSHDFFGQGSAASRVLDDAAQAAVLSRTLSLRTIVQIGRMTSRMTLREALDCKARTFIRLLTADGLISEANKDEWLRGNTLSRAGKDRLELMFAGRAAETPERLRSMSPPLRRKIERIVPCLIRVESRGNGLGILRDVQTALDALYDFSLKRAENERFSLDDYLEQVDFTRVIPPQAKTLARCLALLDRAELGRAADAWAKEADFSPKQLGLFEAAPEVSEETAPFRFWEEALARRLASSDGASAQAAAL